MSSKPHLAVVTCVLVLGVAACSKGTSDSPSPSGGVAAADRAAATPGIDRSGLPSGHAPSGDGQGAPDDRPRGALIGWTVPPAWKQEPAANGMRYAQFRVSGMDGDPEDAECVVFYFGPGQGGSPKDNASRWVSQFRQPDGGSSEARAKIEMKTIGGKQAMFVEVGGTYTASMMGAPSGEPKKDYALIGAIVSGPDAPWFFKMTGPRRTIEANRAAFNDLIASIH
jgi:hypothetical protein